MKRLLFITVLLLASLTTLEAQKIAYVNTETILASIPQYVTAQKQLEAKNREFQQEIEQGYAELDRLYASYQSERSRLTGQQRQARQEAIIKREKELKDRNDKYFGQDGEMARLSKQLLDPVRERVQEAIEAVARAGNYAFLYDVAVGAGIIYKNAAYDISDKVIEKLGYRN